MILINSIINSTIRNNSKLMQNHTKNQYKQTTDNLIKSKKNNNNKKEGN